MKKMTENQNNNNEVNQIINEITPISEIKIENENKLPETNNEQSSSNNNSSSNSKISTILLILLFIFLFAFVMGMPYITDFINNLNEDKGLTEIEQQAKKEEEKQKQEQENNNQAINKQEEKLTTLTCILNDTTNMNYNLIKTQQFNYNKNNQIITSSNTLNYTFISLDETYQELKRKCDEDSLKYINNIGYTMSCNYSDNNIEISDTFELEIFETITDNNTIIQANVTYKQDINTIKDNLIIQGYTCN